jgi:hypothetical protein
MSELGFERTKGVILDFKVGPVSYAPNRLHFRNNEKSNGHPPESKLAVYFQDNASLQGGWILIVELLGRCSCGGAAWLCGRQLFFSQII